MNQILSITNIRAQQPQLVDQVSSLGNTITINVSGEPKAILLSYDQYQSLIETLEITSDKKLMLSIAQSQKEITQGKLYTLEDVLHEREQKTVSKARSRRSKKSS